MQVTKKVQAACDALVAKGEPHPTGFEIETALAFEYFYEKGADLCVIEVGTVSYTHLLNLPENVAGSGNGKASGLLHGLAQLFFVAHTVAVQLFLKQNMFLQVSLVTLSMGLAEKIRAVVADAAKAVSYTHLFQLWLQRSG